MPGPLMKWLALWVKGRAVDAVCLKACYGLFWYLDSLTGERWPGEVGKKKVGGKLTGSPGSKGGD